MDSLAIMGARTGMVRIIIKRLLGQGRKLFVAKNTQFGEDEIMEGCLSAGVEFANFIYNLLLIF